MAQTTNQSRWYPTSTQLSDPAATQQSFRVLLDQFYQLQQSHQSLTQQVEAMGKAQAAGQQKGPEGNANLSTPASSAAATASASAPPPGSGPSDTMLLGLRVAPIDSQNLANGATLKYNKSSGNFEFS